MSDLRFAFVCRRKWAELTGDHPVQRFCDECHRDIINLDSLSKEERDQLFRSAIRSGEKPCVFINVAASNTNHCSAPPRSDEIELDGEYIQELGGEPELDDYDLENSLDEGDEDEIKFDI